MSTDALSQLSNVNRSTQIPSQGPDAATSELGKDAFLKLVQCRLLLLLIPLRLKTM